MPTNSEKKQTASGRDKIVSSDEPVPVSVTAVDAGHHKGDLVVPSEVRDAIFRLLDDRATRTMLFNPNPDVWRPIAATLWALLSESASVTVSHFVRVQPYCSRWPELVLWTCVAEHPNHQIQRYVKQHVEAILQDPNGTLPSPA